MQVLSRDSGTEAAKNIVVKSIQNVPVIILDIMLKSKPVNHLNITLYFLQQQC